MATTYKTPGVYINEINAFPNSVVPISTSVAAFVGYTEKAAAYEGKSYLNNAFRVSSLAEYEIIFGKGPVYRFSVEEVVAGTVAAPLNPVIDLGSKQYSVKLISPGFCLYNSLRLFFANGGTNCYIISVGDYSQTPALADLSAALAVLEKEMEPSILAIPDAVALSDADHATLVQQSLTHCAKMQNRVAVLDVHGAAVSDAAQVEPLITQFRNGTGSNGLSYGAAYFPWLNTGIVSRSEISFLNLADNLSDLLETTPAVINALEPIPAICAAFAENAGDATVITSVQKANQTLLSVSKQYYTIVSAALDIVNVLPPSAAMAGVYAMMDNTDSVAKAPANITLAAVLSPTINLTDQQQFFVNVDMATGKSINAIRAFAMKGVMPWGAKTLDGNSNDYRYINVRRTLIFIEQSLQLSARSFVFEPNTANTWAAVKSMMENFLQKCWQQGVLQGASTQDAYHVAVGLGSTITDNDILDGYMNVSVQVAISRSAEFIAISFQQQMATS